MGQNRSKSVSGVRIALGVFGVLAAGAAWQMWAPSVEIAAKSAAGNAWDGAEPELRATFLEGLKRSFAGVDLAAGVHEAFAGCLAKGAVALLNKTDCRYEYNTATEDKANHLSAQGACMKEAGYPADLDRLHVSCAREHISQGWEIWHRKIHADLEAGIPKESVIDDRPALAECQTQALIALLTELECPALKVGAARLAEIRPMAASCLTSPASEKKRQTSFVDCNVKHTPWEAGRAEFLPAFRKEVDTNLDGLAVPDSLKTEITNCGLEQAITAMNKTGCRYAFNEGTTTEAEHEAAQSACVGKTSYSSDLIKIRIGCLVKHLPNDWEIMRPIITNDGRKFASSRVGADQVEKVTTCLVDAGIALFTSQKCAVVNPAATGIDNLLPGIKGCVESHNLGTQLQAIAAKCTGDAAPTGR